jgi:hypothetical protein
MWWWLTLLMSRVATSGSGSGWAVSGLMSRRELAATRKVAVALEARPRREEIGGHAEVCERLRRVDVKGWDVKQLARSQQHLCDGRFSSSKGVGRGEVECTDDAGWSTTHPRTSGPRPPPEPARRVAMLPWWGGGWLVTEGERSALEVLTTRASNSAAGQDQG